MREFRTYGSEGGREGQPSRSTRQTLRGARGGDGVTVEYIETHRTALLKVIWVNPVTVPSKNTVC